MPQLYVDLTNVFSLNRKSISQQTIGQWQIFSQVHFSNLTLKDTRRRVSIKYVLAKYKILQNCYALRVTYIRNAFHSELQSYCRAFKQNSKPENKWQKVISITECYKDFHLYDKFLFSSVYSRI